jgi:hypothetical protein
MDRTEKPKVRSEFANNSELNEGDASALVGPTGRDAHGQVGSHPRSEVTGRHDAGSGANQTKDGLTSLEEELRRNTEDVPLGEPTTELEDVPVFDRGDMPPKT